MWPFRKKEEEISRINPGYEEHGERKTPKAGIVLLFLMFAAGLFFGWIALDDLSRLVAAPEPLSACSFEYQDGQISGFNLGGPYRRNYYDNSYYYGNYQKNCVFNEIEKRYRIPELIEKRAPYIQNINSAQGSLSEAQNLLYQAQNRRSSLERSYGIGLQERQAGLSEQVYSVSPEVQAQINEALAEESRLNNLISERSIVLEQAKNEMRPLQDQIRVAYRPVFEEHNRALRWYEFKIFLIQFIFVLPLFFLCLWIYARLLRKNSPYTIIFLPILAVVGILALRILLFWFWGLFLAQILEVLIRWFEQFELIRSLAFYGGMLLSFVIFGGGVYYLQKRIFDPRRVIIRRFRAKQCPHCQTSLDLSGNFCPNCGEKIKEPCSSCHQMRFVGMPACPSCGNKIQ